MPGICAQLNCQCILNFLKLLRMKKFLGISWFASNYSCVWGARLLTAKPSSLLCNLITIRCYDFP